MVYLGTRIHNTVPAYLCASLDNSPLHDYSSHADVGRFRNDGRRVYGRAEDCCVERSGMKRIRYCLHHFAAGGTLADGDDDRMQI